MDVPDDMIQSEINQSEIAYNLALMLIVSHLEQELDVFCSSAKSYPAFIQVPQKGVNSLRDNAQKMKDSSQ